jgi:CheY-like chemotaxis protein
MEKKTQQKILIIEDNEFLGEIVLNKLLKSGYDVKLAEDGELGLKEIRESAPDLVLLDIVLPKMNGYEVLEACQQDEKLSEIPIVVVSNSGEPVEIERVLQLGAKDYLVKANFDPDEVLQMVARVLGKGEEKKADEKVKVETPVVSTKENEEPKILVVEDDDFLRDLMAIKLSKKIHSIFYASDGEKAIELTQKEKPDLILLDLILPGMGGFEVLEKIKSDPSVRDIPVIILSNLGGEEKIEKGRELGAEDFLVKANFSIDEIIDKMRNYVSIKV